jgi:Pathogenicity locus
LCSIDAKKHDPCVRDVFAAVVSYAEGSPARPWWEFTPERKEREEACGEEAR